MGGRLLRDDLPACLVDISSWQSLLEAANDAAGAHRIAVEIVARDASGAVLLVQTGPDPSSGPRLPGRQVAKTQTPADAARATCTELGIRLDGLRFAGVVCVRHADSRASELLLQFVTSSGSPTAGEFHPIARAGRLLPAFVAARLEAVLAGVDSPAPLLSAPAEDGCAPAFTVWTTCMAWNLSTFLIGTAETAPVHPVTVEAVDDGRLILSRDSDTESPIPFGLVWSEGHVVLSSQVRMVGDSVARTISAGSGPTAGTRAYLNSQVYAGDPRTAHGLAFSEVAIEGELGGMPAWHVPPTVTSCGTWTIAIHGLGASRVEALRALPALAAAGSHTLVLAYRGDPGVPANPDGQRHLGDTEWRDVVAAINYARERGAARIVLFGWSMGALMALLALDRMTAPERLAVRGLVFDCPLLDWEETLTYQASRRTVPEPLAERVRKQLTERIGVRLADLSALDFAPDVPMLMFVDLADYTVPPGPALRLAEAWPELVRLVRSERGHCRGWNADPVGYEREVGAFLHRVSE